MAMLESFLLALLVVLQVGLVYEVTRLRAVLEKQKA
jgi:hypothetical protein